MNPWFPYLKYTTTGVPLFCFHHSGGCASLFRKWTAVAPSNLDIIPVQLPGRENRFNEPFSTSMGSLIRELTDNMRPFIEGPYVLFGHSLGGVIAFEAAWALAQRGNPPSKVFISACLPPHLIRSDQLIHQLPDSAFLDALKTYGGIPEVILNNQEILTILIPRLRADFELFETYPSQRQERAALLPLHILGATNDTIAPPQLLEEWRRYADATFEVEILDGDHFYYLSDPKRLVNKMGTLIKVPGGA